MILKEYYDSLVKLMTDHPECADMEVIYSIDDEGNGYGNVYYTPSIVFTDGQQFIHPLDLSDYDTTDVETFVVVN